MLFFLGMKKTEKKEMSIVGHDEPGFVLQLVPNSEETLVFCVGLGVRQKGTPKLFCFKLRQPIKSQKIYFTLLDVSAGGAEAPNAPKRCAMCAIATGSYGLRYVLNPPCSP